MPLDPRFNVCDIQLLLSQQAWDVTKRNHLEIQRDAPEASSTQYGGKLGQQFAEKSWLKAFADLSLVNISISVNFSLSVVEHKFLNVKQLDAMNWFKLALTCHCWAYLSNTRYRSEEDEFHPSHR